jgi:hypothetical protein
MSYDDDDVERLLRQLPAPGVPTLTRARHLDMLRVAMASDGVSVEPATAPTVQSTSQAETADVREGGVLVPLRRRRRRVLVAVVAAVAMALLVTAAATIIWRHATVRSEVRCFPGYVTDFDNPRYGDTTYIGGDTATLAVDLCAEQWRDGYLVSTPPYAANGSSTPQPVPHLIACVLPNDEVGVFPSYNAGETCEALGLPRSSG